MQGDGKLKYSWCCAPSTNCGVKLTQLLLGSREFSKSVFDTLASQRDDVTLNGLAELAGCCWVVAATCSLCSLLCRGTSGSLLGVDPEHSGFCAAKLRPFLYFVF